MEDSMCSQSISNYTLYGEKKQGYIVKNPCQKRVCANKINLRQEFRKFGRIFRIITNKSARRMMGRFAKDEVVVHTKTNSEKPERRMVMQKNQKALLVVSFGTSFHDTREKTIDKLERDIQAAFPDRKLYRAWTSKMIIAKLLRRDGIHIDTVSEAMARMLADGVTDVLVQPTHILGGVENDFMTADVLAFADKFAKIAIGDPLLVETEDIFKTIEAVVSELAPADDRTLVLMGHGTTHQTNTVYAALDYMFKDAGHANVFVGTVEAYPTFENVLRMLKASGYKKVTLAPFMIVAGDHATNDMAGADEDSWKSMLEAEGYEVECVLRGIGEFEGIGAIFREHAEKAAAEAN
jgi:sirohydrochlorin cobaltochelatase